MELSLDMKKRYTYADYLTWMDDERRELINGFIKMMSPAPRMKHAEVSFNISGNLWTILQKYKGNGKYDEGTTYEWEGQVPIHIFNNYPMDMDNIFGKENTQ